MHESNGVTLKILHRLLAVATLLMLLPPLARAGGEGSLDYVRSFIEAYPAFRAEGTMTTTMPPNKTYRCRVAIVFQKGKSMKFSYNTDASRDIIPYDYLFEDRKLTETIYNRDRSKTESSTDIGAPMRLVFGFVWDLLEAESNANLQGFIFNGLMSVDQIDLAKRTQIVLKRRLPGIPVEKAVFLFDDDKRLRTLEIEQSGNIKHKIDIRRFRAVKAADAVPVAEEQPSTKAR
jgi:hypothetical protein